MPGDEDYEVMAKARKAFAPEFAAPYGGTERRHQVMPEGSEARKGVPIATGVLDYFPAALAEVAKLSKLGNDKHNPGQPLHWARGKSMDHADCLLRHFTDRGVIDPDTGLSHTVEVVWRGLAMLQEECEANGAPLARGAWPPAAKEAKEAKDDMIQLTHHHGIRL